MCKYMQLVVWHKLQLLFVQLNNLGLLFVGFYNLRMLDEGS